MIAKGTTHNNGAKLASYMMTAKDGERVEFWQLRGFNADNIKDAFRDVHIMAEATKCEQPFFHVQVRNRKGETLTRQQWEHAANRIERILGLSGQPRAITFHIYDNGDEHMHVAWSRIDENTLTARPLPFFKERLKKISRELELEFGLTPVKNEREGPIKYAPTRAQEEQARRLGVDIHEVRNTIRDCWDRSDCGRSFEAALAHERLTLTLGDRRGLVVVDHAGGLHALGKRILGVTVGKMHERMADLDLNKLPGVEQTRDFIRDVSHERQHEKPDLMDRLKQELAEVDKLIAKADPEQLKRARQNIETEQAQQQIDAINRATIHELRRGLAEIDELIAKADPEQLKRARQNLENERGQWDRDRYNNAWQDAVIKAAIEKEKIERRFAEPKPEREKRGTLAGGSREKHWPINPPQPERKSWGDFEKAATEATRDDRTENLKGEAAKVWEAWRQIDQAKHAKDFAALNDKGIAFSVATDAKAFAAALDDKGITFAVVTKDEAYRSNREADFAKAVGNKALRFKEGEIVIVTEPRREYRHNGETTEPRSRVHKLDQSLAAKFVKALDNRDKLQGIDATRQASDQRAQQRAADRWAIRLERATNIKRGGRTRAGNIKDNLHKSPRGVLKAPSMALNVLGKPLELLGNVFEGLFAPKLTPEQIREGEIAARERQAEGRDQIDLSKYTGERALERQQEEQREAARQREREHDRGGRDR